MQRISNRYPRHSIIDKTIQNHDCMQGHNLFILIICDYESMSLRIFSPLPPLIQIADSDTRFRAYFLEMIPWNHSGITPFLITDCRCDSVNQRRAVRCACNDWFQSITPPRQQLIQFVPVGEKLSREMCHYFMWPCKKYFCQ